VKHPLPDGPAVAEAEKQIRDIFKDEYPRKSAADRRALARKLLKAGEESKEEAALQFVALRDARDLAASAGDLVTALAAIDRLRTRFAVDAPDLKAAALRSAARAVESDDSEAVFTAGLHLLDQTVRDGELDAADRMVSLLEELARRLKNPDHLKSVQACAKDLKAQQADAAKAKPLLEKLEKNPDDPDAALAAGRHFATSKGDWARALPLLARGSSPGLKEAAARDLANPEESAARADVGDLWWALSEKEGGPFKAALQGRAADWYARAMDGLSGVRKMQAEKRIQASAEAAGRAGAVVADRIILWNMHNGLHNDRGTTKANVILLNGGREVYAAKGLKMPWEPGKDLPLDVPVPHRPFTSVRVEVTDFTGSGGGLAEIQVMQGRINLALGRPVNSSGKHPADVHPGAETLTDGITTSADYGKGYWALPNSTPGWAEVLFEGPSKGKPAR
jgi:hypothetical protein